MLCMTGSSFYVNGEGLCWLHGNRRSSSARGSSRVKREKQDNTRSHPENWCNLVVLLLLLVFSLCYSIVLCCAQRRASGWDGWMDGWAVGWLGKS